MEDGHQVSKGYSPFTAKKYSINLPSNVPPAHDKKKDTHVLDEWYPSYGCLSLRWVIFLYLPGFSFSRQTIPPLLLIFIVKYLGNYGGK